MAALQFFALGLLKGSALQTMTLSVLMLLFTTYCIAAYVFRPVEYTRRPNGKKYRLPPGPRGFPIIGDLFTLREGPETAIRLGRYGDMTTTHLGSRTWILINTTRLAHELYNKRGSILNGRPPLPIISDIISRGKRSAWNQVPEWSERRRVMHQLLSGSAMVQYAKMQTLESTQLLMEYQHRPDKWYSHHGRYANSVICSIALGERVLGPSKKLADLFQVVADFVMNSPPYNTVDCFPLLTRLPYVLQPWRKKALELSDITFKCYSDYWTPVKKRIEAGEAGPSFARDVLIGDEARYAGSDTDSMYLCIQLIEAGSDTTRITLNIFAMMAVEFPQVYAKARAEVDKVCGANAARLPTFEDEAHLPYVNALIKELLRWRPIFQYPPEHTLTEDLEFEGYSFPKGVSFVLNLPMICSEATGLGKNEAEDFRPERFLDGHEMDILHGNWAFGGGRRVCVGYRLAQRSAFINVARMLYCYDFEATGPIDSSRLNHAAMGEPFPVRPKPRSVEHQALILKEAKLAGVMEDVLNAEYMD